MPRAPAAFSERRFHAWARRHLPAGRVGLLPLGDDTAAVPIGDAVALLTTDAFVEGSHFLRPSPPVAVGRALAAANLSDIAAKGGTPIALLLDLLLPPLEPAAWPKRVSEGAEAEMARAGGHLVGGDTKSSPHRALVGTVLAVGSRRHLAPRTGARAGDLLVTTGTVGRGGAAALTLPRRGTPGRAALLEMLAIHPRLAEGRALVRHARAMLDTSDGLAEAAHLLAEASRVRVVVEIPRIPWDPALLRRTTEGETRVHAGFYGGDYELLASVPPRRWEAAERAVRDAGGTLAIVGSVEHGRGAVQGTPAGSRAMLPRAGWDPFTGRRIASDSPH